VDATPFLKPGRNHLAVRITDPNGDFTWCDWPYFSWGNYPVLPGHGFGGITGKVRMYVTDKSFIEDVFVKNKPAITDFDAEVKLLRTAGIAGTLSFTLSKWGSGEILLEDKLAVNAETPGPVFTRSFSFPMPAYGHHRHPIFTS
jgi:beta-galactosidase